MPPKRKVGRPRKRKRAKPQAGGRRPRRANKNRQAGGQLGALLPLVKFLGPLVLKEVAKLGIGAVLRSRKKGRGLNPAGGRAGRGLKLAGQGHRKYRTPGRKPGSRRSPMILY